MPNPLFDVLVVGDFGQGERMFWEDLLKNLPPTNVDPGDVRHIRYGDKVPQQVPFELVVLTGSFRQTTDQIRAGCHRVVGQLNREQKPTVLFSLPDMFAGLGWIFQEAGFSTLCGNEAEVLQRRWQEVATRQTAD